MKKFIFSFVLLCTTFISVNAQIMRAEELENYAKEKYGENGQRQLPILVRNSLLTKTIH